MSTPQLNGHSTHRSPSPPPRESLEDTESGGIQAAAAAATRPATTATGEEMCEPFSNPALDAWMAGMVTPVLVPCQWAMKWFHKPAAPDRETLTTERVVREERELMDTINAVVADVQRDLNEEGKELYTEEFDGSFDMGATGRRLLLGLHEVGIAGKCVLTHVPGQPTATMVLTAWLVSEHAILDIRDATPLPRSGPPGRMN